MLDLAAHEELSPPEFVAPNKRRSPLVAMLLSMVFPGLGHLYIGLRRHAAWLIGTELLALAGTAYSSGVIHGQFILMPVSYTHLDVYKRQRKNDPPAMGSAAQGLVSSLSWYGVSGGGVGGLCAAAAR